MSISVYLRSAENFISPHAYKYMLFVHDTCVKSLVSLVQSVNCVLVKIKEYHVHITEIVITHLQQ